MLYINTEHYFNDEEIHLAKTIAKDVAFATGVNFDLSISCYN
jgi:hypothetical protein